MAPPSPEVPLDDACTAIYDNTLYAYSKDAFQSLKLEDGAAWKTLSMGMSVTNGVCVKATPDGDSNPDALYIVGGRANDSMIGSYSGLQRYDFSKSAWDIIDYPGGRDVTMNRTYHSATFLNASASILIYAGSTENSMSLSSQTFTIDTSSDYAVLSYESGDAPPGIAPLLMPWSDSEAVMVGGTDTNTKVVVFSPTEKIWIDTNTTLAEPLRNSSYVKGVIVDGDDGSKNLITFDMTVSPNSVNRTILLDASSDPVSNSAPISSRSLVEASDEEFEQPAKKRVKRDLTLSNWPTYNDTLAPTTIRSGYSVAFDATSGLLIGAGGNTDDTLCMFETKTNSWMNATAELGSTSAQTVVGSGSTKSNTTSATSATSSSAAVDSQADSRAISMKILAAVLSSILGLAALLLICLLLLRWRAKRKMFQDAGHARRASGLPVDDEKAGMDFADRAPANYTVPQQGRYRPGHGQQDSVSSMAILMGRIGPGHQRGYDKENGSIASNSSSVFNQKYKTAISSPVLASPTGNVIAKPNAAAPPRPRRGEKDASFVATEENPRPRGSNSARRGSARRSSGWNRYWSGGSAMNILGFGSKRTTVSSDRSSFTESRSAIVPPLQIPQAADLHLNRVHSNSPTVSQSNFTLREPSTATLERPMSEISSDDDFDDRRDEFSSGVPSSVNSWPPHQLNAPWANGRASDAYTESNYGGEVGLSMPRQSEDHPPLPIQGHTLDVPDKRRSVSQYTVSSYGGEGESDHPQLPIQGHQVEEKGGSDMSWLNLGVDAEKK